MRMSYPCRYRINTCMHMYNVYITCVSTFMETSAIHMHFQVHGGIWTVSSSLCTVCCAHAHAVVHRSTSVLSLVVSVSCVQEHTLQPLAVFRCQHLFPDERKVSNFLPSLPLITTTLFLYMHYTTACIISWHNFPWLYSLWPRVQSSGRSQPTEFLSHFVSPLRKIPSSWMTPHISIYVHVSTCVPVFIHVYMYMCISQCNVHVHVHVLNIMHMNTRTQNVCVSCNIFKQRFNLL